MKSAHISFVKYQQLTRNAQTISKSQPNALTYVNKRLTCDARHQVL